MPRAYTDQEQQHIRETLLHLGQALFEEQGLGGVTISTLTAEAGIGKGSFYLFFPNKESLFFAIQERLESAFKQRLAIKLSELEHEPAKLVEQFVTLHLHELSTHRFLRHLVDPGVIGALQAKVPAAILAAHQASDKAYYTSLVRGWIDRDVLPASTDPDLIFSVLAAAFALSVSRDLVGDQWHDVVTLMARALARELTAAD